MEEKDFKVVDKRRFTSEGGLSDIKEEETKESYADTKEAEKPEEPVETDKKPSEPLPPPDFITLVVSMGASALMYLGDTPDADSEKHGKNLKLIRHTIDMIEMLEEKTKGNLTSAESKVVKDLLSDLKMRYVRAAG
jgi:hypothetical protein